MCTALVPFEEPVLRLSRLTDYGIVLLAALSQWPAGVRASSRDLAETTQLPLPTVSKIMKTLSRGGIVHATRGAHGGYELVKPSASVTVAEVIEAMEGPLALTACSTHGGEPCADEAHCPLSPKWPQINLAVRTALLNVSLDDLVRPTPPSTVQPDHAPVVSQVRS